VKLPETENIENLCEACVGLCCRYFAFEIAKPKTRRDFDDMRWYLLHEDCIIFVEDGDWYIQINRKCKKLRPDNFCGIYETRPQICREYTTKECDYHGEEYEYDHLFTEPEQIARFADEYFSKRKKRKKAAGRSNRQSGANSAGKSAGKKKKKKTTARKKKKTTSRKSKKTGKKSGPARLLKSA
jgi:Fe-S-cluster containining protein